LLLIQKRLASVAFASAAEVRRHALKPRKPKKDQKTPVLYSADAWADLGFTPAEAQDLRIRSGMIFARITLKPPAPSAP
jgi:hypothetical protein